MFDAHVHVIDPRFPLVANHVDATDAAIGAQVGHTGGPWTDPR